MVLQKGLICVAGYADTAQASWLTERKWRQDAPGRRQDAPFYSAAITAVSPSRASVTLSPDASASSLA